MSNKSLPGFTIEYSGAGVLIATETHPGSIAKAENWAIIGLIRHLYAGAEQARILDPSGSEIKVLHPALDVTAPAEPSAFG